MIAGLCAAIMVWCVSGVWWGNEGGEGDGADGSPPLAPLSAASTGRGSLAGRLIAVIRSKMSFVYISTTAAGKRDAGTVGSALALACAAVRAGATPVEAFEQQAGRRFAAPDLTTDRILDALDRSAAADPPERRHAAAHRLMWACALSRSAGCSPVDAVEAVRAGIRRDEDAEGARAAALAVPRATVRMLTALPALLLLAGTAMSSHPIRFLFGSLWGWLCLAAGALLETSGVLWTRRAIARFLARTSAFAVECDSTS